MNVGELKALLEEMDDDAEVRIASQPSWPFENEVASVIVMQKPKELLSDEEVDAMSQSEREHYMDACDNGEFVDPHEMPEGDIVYIGEGRQIGYLPTRVKGRLGW